MPITTSNAEAALAAVRKLSEQAVTRPSRTLRTVPLATFVTPPAPNPEVTVFSYANLKKEAA